MLVCSIQAFGQYHQDALRFSQTNFLVGSSGRMQGIAGAQTSLGGDISSAGSNPAGLGFFNRGSAVYTMGLDFQNSDDEFSGLTTPNFSNVFGIRNAGVVMNYNKGRFTEEKFKGGSLGITFSKVSDYNRDYSYEGASGTSIVDFFLDQAYQNGLGTGTYGAAAYNQFLIDYDDPSNPTDYGYYKGNTSIITPVSDPAFAGSDFTSPFGAGYSEPYQFESISERGGQHQFNLSWGGNYDDRFYFGAGLGVRTLYYQRTRELRENDFLIPDGTDNVSNWASDPWMNSIDFRDKLVARGAGINMSFGAILRPVDMITVGVSYQTPTFMNINEESEFDLTAFWGEGYSYYDSLGDGITYDLNEDLGTYLSPIFETTYKIKTPARLNLGTTVFLGKTGFITADVEMVDYANAELQSRDFSTLTDNQRVQDFESVVNYRLGAEFRMDNIRFRGGLGMNQDPSGNGNDQAITTFGIGYKSSDYFVDLAIVNTKFDQQYNPYTFGVYSLSDPIVNSTIRNTTVTVSAGFSF